MNGVLSPDINTVITIIKKKYEIIKYCYFIKLINQGDAQKTKI